ncbi:protoglobin domain-containing protein [Paenibacillus pinisoli]|nr:globin-coupled sensor protein [Paenibacillus pinisoli]
MKKCPFSAISSQLMGRKNTLGLPDWKESEPSLDAVICIDDPVIVKQLEMIELTLDDIRLAKSLQALIERHIDTIVDTFYQTITNVDQLKDIIVENSTIERLQFTLKAHLIEMFSGHIDEDFLKKRQRVASVHYRIGLEPKWYMGAFQNLQDTLLNLVYRHVEDREQLIRISTVITKILNFEQQIVLEAYEKENVRQRELQYERVKEELKHKITVVSEDMTVIAEQTRASVQHLVASSADVNGSVHRGAEASRHTQALAAEGQTKLAALEASIASILMRTSSMDEVVKQLNQSVQEIGQVVSLVQDIAVQTNLLALNSAIEAARAGEHGRGFAVVAQEVRKLSDQTKQSVTQIHAYIVQTREYSEKVAASITEVHSIVQDSKSESEATEVAFQHIVQSMSSSLATVETVEQGMKALVQTIEEIGQATDKVVDSAATLHQAAQQA